jgi:hypothetical protein
VLQVTVSATGSRELRVNMEVGVERRHGPEPTTALPR